MKDTERPMPGSIRVCTSPPSPGGAVPSIESGMDYDLAGAVHPVRATVSPNRIVVVRPLACVFLGAKPMTDAEHSKDTEGRMHGRFIGVLTALVIASLWIRPMFSSFWLDELGTWW